MKEPSDDRKFPLVLMAFMFLYLLTARLGLLFVLLPEKIASIWPVSGLALAFLLLAERRHLVPYIAAIFVANTIANLWGGNPLSPSLGFALANTLEALLARWTFLQISRRPPDFKSFRDLAALVAAGAFSNALTALAGAVVVFYAFGAPYWETWRLWWSADGLGIMLVTPGIVILWTSRNAIKGAKLSKAFELLAFLLMVIAIVMSVMGTLPEEYRWVRGPYWLLGVIILCAIRLDNWRTMLIIGIVSLIALTSIVTDYGKLPWISSSHVDAMIQIQGYLITMIVVALGVSIALIERRKAEQKIVAESFLRNLLFENSPDGILIIDPRTAGFIEFNRTAHEQLGYTREEFSKLKVTDVEAMESADETISHIEKIMKKGRDDFETRQRTKQGEIRDIKVIAQLIDVDGNGVHHCIWRDITESKRLEQHLKQSEERFRALTVHNPDHVLIQDRDLRYSFVLNPQLGLSAAEMIGKTDHNILAREDADRLAEVKKRVLDQGESIRFEPILKSRSGNMEYFDGYYIPKLDAEGKVDGLFGYFRNVTEQRSIEQERLAANDLLRIINAAKTRTDLIRESICYLKNYLGCEAVGIRLHEGEDFPYFETIGFPEDFVEAERYLCSYKPEGEAARCLGGQVLLECMCGNIIEGRFDAGLPFFTPHGSFWTNSTSELLAGTTESDRQGRTRNRCNGEGYESVGLFPLRDAGETFGLLQVNERRRGFFTERTVFFLERFGDNLAVALSSHFAKERLQKSEAFLNETQRISMVGGWVFEVASRKLTWTEETYLIHDLKPDEYFPSLSRGLDYFEPASAEVFQGAIQRAIDSGESFSEELQMVTATGRKKWVHVIGHVEQRGSRFGQVRGTIQDITARREMADRLRRLETFEVMGRIAGGVAHDLNNIIGVSVGYADLLADAPEVSPRLQGALRKIKEAGMRASSVIQDLLTLTRKGAVVRETANLNNIIREYLKSPEHVRLKERSPQVRSDTSLDGHLMNISGSEIHLYKLVMNLVINAFEATSQEGTVGIVTENAYLESPLRGYELIPKGEYAVLTVSDTGEGISPPDMSHIFEPFYTTKKMKMSGSGLGLSVVLGVVKDHEGFVDVRSEKGKGTTFSLYFPVTRKELPKREPARRISLEYMGHGEKVLVVDDEKWQCEMAEIMLMQLGYRVTTVMSGEDAISYLKANSADLIVLDMLMEPGIDGLDTYREAVKLHPGQRAILVSGFAETERSREAQQLGAGPFVRKPYIQERLGMEVRKELDRNGSR